MQLEANLIINFQNFDEISPKDIFTSMKNNTYNFYTQNLTTIAASQNYFSMKLKMIPLLHKFIDRMKLKPQTFYLGLYYLDIIYSNNNQIQNLANKYIVISITCLILSAKMCENDPKVPSLKTFANTYNKLVEYKKIITVKELFYYEVFCLKLLNYKLNYFTVYDFNLFLLGHGLLRKGQIEDVIKIIYNNDPFSVKKIIEKIFKKCRYYLDLLINTQITFKYNSLLISIYIILKSIEFISLKEYKLKKSEYDQKNIIIRKNSDSIRKIMNECYNFDYESMVEYKNLENDIEFQQIFKHKKPVNSSKRMDGLNSSKSKAVFDLKKSDKKICINKLNKLQINSSMSYKKINTNIQFNQNTKDSNNITTNEEISNIIMPPRIELFNNQCPKLKKRISPLLFGNLSPQTLFVKKVVQSKRLSSSISPDKSNNNSSNISFKKFQIGKIQNLKEIKINNNRMSLNETNNLKNNLCLTNSKSNYDQTPYIKKYLKNSNSNTIILDRKIYNKKFPYDPYRVSPQLNRINSNPSVRFMFTRNSVIPKKTEIKNIINNIEINNISDAMSIFDSNKSYTSRIMVNNLKYSNINKKDKMHFNLMNSLGKVNERNESEKQRKTINKILDLKNLYKSNSNKNNIKESDKTNSRFIKKNQRIKRIKNNEKVNEKSNINYLVNN